MFGAPEVVGVSGIAGGRGPVLLCRLSAGSRAISTAVLGGGIGPVRWWINVQVDRNYARADPAVHLREVAERLESAGRLASVGQVESAGPGVGMLTAARVDRWTAADDGGVHTVATVGLGLPAFAAAAEEIDWSAGPGTINLLVRVPVPLSDAALVNAVITATEAKTQALLEAGIPGTGTSSDALCIVCPEPVGPVGEHGVEDYGVEDYGGPRSRWGSKLARSVHRAVAAGTADWIDRHPPEDGRRRW